MCELTPTGYLPISSDHDHNWHDKDGCRYQEAVTTLITTSNHGRCRITPFSTILALRQEKAKPTELGMDLNDPATQPTQTLGRGNLLSSGNVEANPGPSGPCGPTWDSTPSVLAAIVPVVYET